MILVALLQQECSRVGAAAPLQLLAASSNPSGSVARPPERVDCWRTVAGGWFGPADFAVPPTQASVRQVSAADWLESAPAAESPA
jgi:hypothetical protein